MNFIQLKQAVCISLLLFTAAQFSACTPDTREDVLGPRPDASFTVTPVPSKLNTYLLTSTSTGVFSYRWDVGDGTGFEEGGTTDTAYYPEKGNYTVKLLVLGKGGYDTVTNTITVAADDPSGCFGPKALLTGCATKTWVLSPTPGALWIGPNDVGAGAWWANGDADVTAPDRTCLFNDEYTFGKDGSFVFNDKGDFRVDDEGGNAWPTDIGFPISCVNTSQIPAKYSAWGSGNFTFKIVGGNKLQVNGTGAHLGLYKVGENGTAATPDASITYDIVEISANKLVVRKQYSWGQWRFVFTPKA